MPVQAQGALAPALVPISNGPAQQEKEGGGIEGADARQSAARSTAPRRTHAQTTSSPSIMPLPAGEASRHHSASVYRSNRQLKAVARSAVVGDAIAIGGLKLRPPRGVGWLDLPTVAMHHCWTETGSQMTATGISLMHAGSNQTGSQAGIDHTARGQPQP